MYPSYELHVGSCLFTYLKLAGFTWLSVVISSSIVSNTYFTKNILSSKVQ